MATPTPTIPHSPAGSPPLGGLTRKKKRIVIVGVAGVIVVLCLILLFARGCSGSPSRKPPTPPPKTQPQAQQQQQQLAASSPVTEPAKPSPMPPEPAVRPARTSATPVTKLAARTPVVSAAASSQERELKRIGSRLREIDRRTADAVNTLGEIRGILERQQPVVRSAYPAQPRPRRERLSDRELERRYKERLLSQEP